MELSRARYLVSDRGRTDLGAIPVGLQIANPTKLAAELRRSFPPAEASALAEQLTLRAQAARRHGPREGFLYTAEGLEMMTHPLVAARRARRLASAERDAVDLTSGIGGDLAAVAGMGIDCAGLERDPAHALLAAANANVSVARGDAGRAPFDVPMLAVILDPSRRAGGARRFDPAAFSPNWDTTVALAMSASLAVIKASPGIDAAYVPPVAEVEAIQLRSSMRELSLWFGDGTTPGLRRAVLLPSDETLDSTDPQGKALPQRPGSVIFDPESCVTRATLVTHLASRLGAWLLDPHLAYLSSDTPAFSSFAATFEVLDAMPFSLSRLKQHLRKQQWRPEEIRRRAFPVEPDELRKLLGRLPGEPVTLLLTTIGGERLVFVCRRLFSPA